MRIRRGFVSNSSSSSFVVAWPRKPETIEDISKFLFADQTIYANPYPWDDVPSGFPVLVVSNNLFGSLQWEKEKVHDVLVTNLEVEFSCILSEVAERSSNSLTIENGKIVPCFTIAQRQLGKYVALLEKWHPRIHWQARIDAIIVRRKKWHIIQEKLNKQVGILVQKLRKKHNCVFSWSDTSKMTEEEKVAYKKACDENYKKYEEKVLKDPEYVVLNEKYQKASRKKWNEPKNMTKTLSTVASCLADIFYKENKGSIFSSIEIYDNNTMGAAMEHGDLFSRLPHKRFSNH